MTTEENPVDAPPALVEMRCAPQGNSGDLYFSSKEREIESGRPRFAFCAQRVKDELAFNIFDLHKLESWYAIKTPTFSTDHASFVGTVDCEMLRSGHACFKLTDNDGRPTAALFCEFTFRKIVQDALHRVVCSCPPKWEWDFFFCDTGSIASFESALADISDGQKFAAGVKMNSSGIYTAFSASESNAKEFVGTLVNKNKTSKEDVVAVRMEKKADEIEIGHKEPLSHHHAVGFVLGQLLVGEKRGPRLTACQRVWQCVFLPFWLCKICLFLAVAFVAFAAIWYYLIYIPFALPAEWAPSFPWEWKW